jgi:lytic murein transglycosylase
MDARSLLRTFPRLVVGVAVASLSAAAATAAPAPALADAACLRDLRAATVAAGVSGADFDRVTKGLTLDPSVLRSYSTQPETNQTTADYIRALVDDERIADGRKALAEHKATFAAVEKRFGVPAHVLAAFWGIETDYGRNLGKRPVLQSLATLVCGGARVSFFRSEFILAVKIVASGQVRAEDMVGSWAGAFGHTQFLPSNFVEDAVDVDGDGRIELVRSIPDALGSAANQLIHKGWVAGQPWGYEVTVPAGFDASTANRKDKRSFAEWARLGVKRVDGAALPATGTAGMVLPAGRRGPVFLTTRNFDAIYGYNTSESYSLAVAHLSDRLAGGGGFKTPWPHPSSVLSRAEVREIQSGLNSRGYDAGVADGLAGPLTRAAIGAFEKTLGKPTTGEPSKMVLDALRIP